ncbi:MAG: hypothetical protein KGH92_10790, partial [Xanthomonadaceae bacterium]|nr:hypothetical protein [Xanthomonadaceae bacterium]
RQQQEQQRESGAQKADAQVLGRHFVLIFCSTGGTTDHFFTHRFPETCPRQTPFPVLTADAIRSSRT